MKKMLAVGLMIVLLALCAAVYAADQHFVGAGGHQWTGVENGHALSITHDRDCRVCAQSDGQATTHTMLYIQVDHGVLVMHDPNCAYCKRTKDGSQ